LLFEIFWSLNSSYTNSNSCLLALTSSPYVSHRQFFTGSFITGNESHSFVSFVVVVYSLFKQFDARYADTGVIQVTAANIRNAHVLELAFP
jgi:hypothetical protein